MPVFNTNKNVFTRSVMIESIEKGDVMTKDFKSIAELQRSFCMSRRVIENCLVTHKSFFRYGRNWNVWYSD